MEIDINLEAESLRQTVDFETDTSSMDFGKPSTSYKKHTSAMLPVRFSDNKQGIILINLLMFCFLFEHFIQL